MKNLYFLFCLLLGVTPQSTYSQWEDSFSDGNLTLNPTWFGDTEQFNIENGRLQLNADEAGSSNLFSTYEILDEDNIEWKFDVELDFSPSQNNGIKFILYAADSLYWTNEAGSNSRIYFLKFGESGSSDAIELYKQDFSSDPILICRGQNEYIASSFHRKYKIRYENGQWTIYSAAFSSPYYELEAEAEDDIIAFSSAYLGLDLYYTSSNTSNFSFDDISIMSFIPDTIAPTILNTEVIDETHLKINFSESVDSSALQNTNYFLLEMLATPTDIVFENTLQSSVLLSFEEYFIAWANLSLQVNSLKDINGNSSSDILSDFIFIPIYEAQLGDLRISEIMPDPSPPLGLPNAEFIELFNSSDSILTLENFALINSGEARYLPSFTLYPDSFVVICKESDLELFSDYGSVIGLTNWITLLNTGDSLLLKNRLGQVLDRLNYMNDWYESSLKAEGGWSLEKVDLTISCQGSSNWKESVDIHGGTPGKINSRINDEVVNDIYLTQAFILDSNYLQIELSGELDSSVFLLTMVSASPSFSIDWEVSIYDDNGLKLYCDPAFEENTTYKLTLHNLKACNGEIVQSKEFEFAMEESANPGDIVINEILFNSYTGANDFVEVYNRSEKFIDLKNWRLNRMEEGVLVEDAKISDKTMMIAPNEILAFSKDIDELPILYPSSGVEQLRRVNDLPNFPDDEGELYLMSSNFIAIDSLFYNEKMHFPLLEDVNGVSLERIHPERSSEEESSWASASEKVFYATPGSKNSHFLERALSTADIKIEPKLFTPNNDGDKDLLFIHYNFKEGGWQGKINIYNKDGLIVKELMRNSWIESVGIISWDGLDDNDEALNVGIYIVYFEVINALGDKMVFKKPCVLGKIL